MALQLQQHRGYVVEQDELKAAGSNPYAYARILEACGKAGALMEGRRVHRQMVASGISVTSSLFLSNALLQMYANCGSRDDTASVLEVMPQMPSAASWSALIAAEGHFEGALLCFRRMLQSGGAAQAAACIALFKAASNCGQAALAHSLARSCGFEDGSDAYVASALLGMYARCGGLRQARQVFAAIRNRAGVVAWNAMITALSRCGCEVEASRIAFRTMLLEGVPPSSVTFLCVARAAAEAEDLDEVLLVHGLAVEAGFISVVNVANTIIFAYDKCGRVEEALRLFESMPSRDLTTSNTMIAALAHHGRPAEAIAVFRKLPARPDAVSFINALEACNGDEMRAIGRQIHSLATKCGLDKNEIVATAIISMYRRCGDVPAAAEVFPSIESPGVVAWNAMISAYASSPELLDDALQLFRGMIQNGVLPSEFTFIILLGVCASDAWLARGSSIHAWANEWAGKIRRDLPPVLVNAIVFMYGKCGSIERARTAFEAAAARRSGSEKSSWNAMIGAYAHSGRCDQAMDLFREMQQQGMRPDAITYTSVLAAASHGKLVEQGCRLLYAALSDYGDRAGLEHCGCVVDMLGRAGWLAEAEEFLLVIQGRDRRLVDAAAWMSLLNACQTHGDEKRGRRAAERVVAMQPRHAGCYSVLSNMCRDLTVQS